MTLCMTDLAQSIDPQTRAGVSAILAGAMPDNETCDLVATLLKCVGLHPGDANVLASWTVYDRKRCW